MVEHIFLRWGLCSEVLSDLGPEFQAELTSELLRVLGVTRLKTSGYRPSTNGVCEVWHRIKGIGPSGWHMLLFVTMPQSTQLLASHLSLFLPVGCRCGLLI